MKVIVFLFLLFSIKIYSQPSQNESKAISGGIVWVSGMSWEEIKVKAQNEHKYIFVDCYATWCGPCKTMDKKVYPNDSVGAVVNTDFISVKVQFDTTKDDGEDVENWYATAKKMKYDFAISAMPTFLFFSPDGQIIHKDVGSKDVKQFISLVKEATDPNKQYYNLVRKFNEGKLEFNQMSALVNAANNLTEYDFASKVARQFLNYLNTLPEEELLTKENIGFAGQSISILKSSDKLFLLCLNNRDKVHSIVRKGFASDIVDYVITKENIAPILNQAKNKEKDPRWTAISKKITKKYGLEYSQRVTLNAKVKFYKSTKNLPRYASSLVEKIEIDRKEGSGSYLSAISLNQSAWDVFLYSNDKGELNKALEWCERVFQLDSVSFNVGPHMDTWANLLYKLGKVKEAIKLQERAIRWIDAEIEKLKITYKGNLPENAIPVFLQKSMKDALEDMKFGRPTNVKGGALWSKKLLPSKIDVNPT